MSRIATLSDGTVFDNDHEYRKKKETYERLHRKFSKHRCSPDRDKHKKKLKHAYTRLKNHRNSGLHRVSKDIV